MFRDKHKSRSEPVSITSYPISIWLMKAKLAVMEAGIRDFADTTARAVDGELRAHVQETVQGIWTRLDKVKADSSLQLLAYASQFRFACLVDPPTIPPHRSLHHRHLGLCHAWSVAPVYPGRVLHSTWPAMRLL